MARVARAVWQMAPAVMRYGLAVVSVAAALLVTELLQYLTNGPPWMIFLAAVMVSSWVGGFGPGLLAVLLSTLAVDYFYVPPFHILSPKIGYLPRLIVFGLSALLIAWLSDRRKRAEAALRQARDELEARVQERTAELTRTNEQLQAEIAERTRAEEALREQANLLNLTHDTIFVCDMNDVITYWNRGAEELYGWTAEEAVGQVSHQLKQTIYPLPRVEVCAELLRTGRWEGELVHTKRDGTQVVVASRWSLQRDAQGRPIAVLKTNTDITERKRAEAKLRESEQRYRNIFDTAGVSIWEEDFSEVKAAIDEVKAQGVRDFRQYLAAHPEFVRRAISMVKIVDVNDATVRLFGARSKDELLVSLHAIFTPETQDVFAGELVAIAEGRTSFEAETVLQTLQGDKRAVLFTMTIPPEPTTPNRVLVSVMDITKRRQAEEALREVQTELAHVTRVLTLGELVASIAHEVNQPLTAVITNGNACLRWLTRDPPNLKEAQEAVRRLIRDGNRASEVIGRIRTLLRKAEPQKARLAINDVIGEVIALAQGELRRHGVVLHTDLGVDLPPVLADRIQLQQVLLNLLLNGIEAMRTVMDRPRELHVRSQQEEADAICVAVQDAGVGIDPQHLERIFTPFFTTKPAGLGMGLSISRSIIEAHGGRLWATPNIGPGVTVQFTLPTGDDGAS